MVHQNVGRRGVQAPIRHECVEDGPADRAVLSCGAGSRPKFFEAAARFGWATRHAVGECHRIHGAGAGAADGLDANSLVLEELVENTPGESAVGAAALQGEFDRLFRLTFHPTSPDPGSAARPNRDETAPAVLSNVRGSPQPTPGAEDRCSLVRRRVVANHRFFPAGRENTVKSAIARSIGGETDPASLCYIAKPSGKFPRRPNRELNRPNRELIPPNREPSENHIGCAR